MGPNRPNPNSAQAVERRKSPAESDWLDEMGRNLAETFPETCARNLPKRVPKFGFVHILQVQNCRFGLISKQSVERFRGVIKSERHIESG